MNKKFTIIAIATAFIIGGGVSAQANAAEPSKTTVVTKTVQGPERIVTKEVPGPVTNTTPPECIVAIDLASKVILAVGDEHTAFSEAANKASASGDIPAFLNELNAAIGTMTGVVTDTTPPITAAVAACRASVK